MSMTVLQGDVIERLRELPDESAQMVCTSPPYWRQRDYGHPQQIGLEATPEEYVGCLTVVFREVRRVLRSDGVLFLNVGDKWASGGNGGGGSLMRDRATGGWSHAQAAKGGRAPPPGYKDKDLIGLPWMLATALRADGWYLRQCNIWAKPNCMPESMKDRSTASHEYVFQLSKSATYFYDSEAARTPAAPESDTRLKRSDSDSMLSGSPRGGAGRQDSRQSDKQRGHSRRHNGFNDRWDAMSTAEQRALGANLRSVWWIAPSQSTDEHFAQMPEALAEICILVGPRVGDMVCDPFAGSGTTLAVALSLGRQAIGIELNEKYVELINRRIAYTTLGLPLGASA